jgi:hypothetical protein
MTLDEAYERLGLVPLDHYMRETLDNNRRAFSHLPKREIYRRLGATTWMCVRAAMELNKSDVLLLGCYGEQQLFDMIRRTARFAARLWLLEVSHDHSGRHLDTGKPRGRFDCIEMSNGTELRWSQCSRGQKVAGVAGFRGTLFSDWEWAERMERRAKGPFAMVREIRKVPLDPMGDRHAYRAYAEEGEHLMELTHEGALALCQSDRSIRCIGWAGSPRPSLY